MKTALIVMLAALAAVAVFFLKPASEIPASAIGTTQVVRGLLGRPIGTIVTVECRRLPPPQGEMKDPSAWEHEMEVLSVDGHPLAQSVTMEWKYHFCADVQWPKNGATIAIVGYEDGGFVGTPDGAYKFAPPCAGKRYLPFQNLVCGAHARAANRGTAIAPAVRFAAHETRPDRRRSIDIIFPPALLDV